MTDHPSQNSKKEFTMNAPLAPISTQIWADKYRLKDALGNPIEATVKETWRRIAKAIAKAEPNNQEQWEQTFFEALEDYKFLPAGRIVAGSGTGRDVTLFNCFVMGTIPDNMGGIFDMLKEAALTMQQGGGIGYDFSTIRPKGALVKGVAADASGSVSFMQVWDAMCRTIMSAGSRRGAMMATLRCDHPDVMDFIGAKKDGVSLKMFNMSVLITDDFMEAVVCDKPWELIFEGKVYNTLPARFIWDAIMTSTYEGAEPGIIFIDRINKDNNLNYLETICATNPCGEQPLPPYGACLLGSINLAKFVVDGVIDFDSLERVVKVAVRMLDNVIDVSKFPLEKQEIEALSKRRIGLGVTGLADMLVMLGYTYGNPEAVKLTELIMKIISITAYKASISLAGEKGSFPLLDADKFCQSGNMQKMPAHIRDGVKSIGIRNALITSVAPTGTISLYAGNVSSGIEPIFAHSYSRDVLEKDGVTKRKEIVQDYAVAQFKHENPNEPLPDCFVSAQTLSPSDHVKMQAAAQKWVDSSISKTVNCPKDISFDDFKNVYMEAWELGCKGCTTYRPNDKTGSILEAIPEAEGGACFYDPETGIKTCEE